MTTAATQLHFAAQFTMFIVAVAGLALSVRPRLLGRDRPAGALLAAGFATLALGAFLQGSLLVDPGDEGGRLILLRVAGAVLVGLGSSRWAASRTGHVLLLTGLTAAVASEVVAGTRGSGPFEEVILVLGAVAIGVALAAAGRRSIPARITTSAATLLLLVVLSISLALSVVLTRNVEREALSRYGSRTDAEAAGAVASARSSLSAARLVAGSLAGGLAPDLIAATEPRRSGATDLKRAGARTHLDQALSILAGDDVLGLSGPILVVDPAHVPQAGFPTDTDNATRLALAGSEVVVEATGSQGARQSVAVVGDRAYAIAAVPLFVRSPASPRQFRGVVVMAQNLGRSYLDQRSTGGEPLSFALVTATSVLASSGPRPPDGLLLDTGRRVVDGGERPSGIVAGRFLIARPVLGSTGLPDMALVTSVPTAAVARTREDLFRTLFLLALVAALAAVAAAVIVGERIGGGVRRLTVAAERIRKGDLDAVASVGGRDELGRLGATFNSMSGSIRTMTGDLRRAAEEEALLRIRLQTVLGGMGEALVAGDGDGIVTDCNPAAERLLGRSAFACIGHPLNDVVAFTPADGREVDELVPPGEGVSTAVGSVRGPDRNPIPVAVTVAALPESAGAVLVLRDLRDEQEVERMKREFLASISHELRTPLTPIKGYASVLQRRALAPAQTADFASEITAGVDQLERVITRLVNFATVAAGRLDLVVEPVPVSALVDDAVDRWRDRVSPDHPLTGCVSRRSPMVRVDRLHVDHAVDELIDNAVKHSPDGGRIIIGADLVDRRADGTGGSVCLSVTDEGAGLDPGRLEALVAAFAQGDGSTTRRVGGLGLGLAFTDRIVRAHGGSLVHEPVDGRGSRFCILLPTDPEDDEMDVTV